MALQKDPYKTAAFCYLIYGIFYLSVAFSELTPARKTTFWGIVPWWSFYILGLIFVIFLPWLILKRKPLLCLILAIGPGTKALYLLYQQEKNFHLHKIEWYNLSFALLAMVTSLMLFYASFYTAANGGNLTPKKPRASGLLPMP